MEGLVTPPFRVGQSSTHVYVEAQCPEAVGSAKAEAVCDDIVFVFKLPPYYLPLHFPGPIAKVEQIHHTGSVVRIDLVKAEPGVEFIGLDEIQPTMYADEPREQQLSEVGGASSLKRPADPEAEALLKDVLQRENMSAVKDDKKQKGRSSGSAEGSLGTLFESLDTNTLRDNRLAAEAAEDAKFDEHAYLDAYVDEYGEVTDALEWKFHPTGATSSDSDDGAAGSGGGVDRRLRLLLLDILYAYHLALIHSTGPPVYAWLVCALSRSCSHPAAPPMQEEDTVQDVLRAGYRRGLAYPLHRSWKLCERGGQDVIARLSAGKAETVAALQEVIACLQEGAKEAPEGPDEAERWQGLVATVLQPLSQRVATWQGGAFSKLARDVQAALPNLTKANVGATWDLELLEQMAQDVLAENATEQGARLEEARRRLQHLCLELTPPMAMQDGYDAFATPTSDDERAFCDRWRRESAPAHLRELSKNFTAYSLRRLWGGGGGGDETADISLRATIAVAASRFLHDAQSPWSTPTTAELALRITSRAGLRPTLEMIRVILRDHIRPLFASPTAGSVTDQGRLRHETANLVPSVRSGLIDEGEAWQGKRGAEMPGGVQARRSVGAGSHSVLALCLAGTRRLSGRPEGGDAGDAWEQLWPLTLPPLMTMVQASDPLWRYRGVKLLVRYLLSPSRVTRDRWGMGVMAGASSPPPSTRTVAHGSALEMLQRTNLVALLQETLYTNLTYLSHRRGTALLDESLHGLLRLADCTLPHEGREQAEEYMKMVQEGILRTWTFMPRSLTVDDGGGDEGGADVVDSDDLLMATYRHLRLLAGRLGPLSARYLDVTLEFLSGQVSGLYTALQVSGSTRAATVNIKLSRTAEALGTIAALVRACADEEGEDHSHPASPTLPRLPPNLRRWYTPCLIATTKVWLAMCDHDVVAAGGDGDGTVKIERRDVQGVAAASHLIGEIRGMWTLWRALFPTEAEKVYATVSRREASIACVAVGDAR